MGVATSGVLAHIGKSVQIKGQLSGGEDVVVDGQLEGTVDLSGNSFTIGPNGRVRANIVAKNVTVGGTLDGNITASERTELHKTAVVNGDVQTRRIAVEEGAYLKGKLEIVPAEPGSSLSMAGMTSTSVPPRVPESRK